MKKRSRALVVLYILTDKTDKKQKAFGLYIGFFVVKSHNYRVSFFYV